MNPDELLRLLKSMRDAHDLARAIRSPEAQAAHGWDLKRWACDETHEAVRFVHHNPHGQPDSAILCINAAESCRWVYEATLKLAPCATRLVALEP